MKLSEHFLVYERHSKKPTSIHTPTQPSFYPSLSLSLPPCLPMSVGAFLTSWPVPSLVQSTSMTLPVNIPMDMAEPYSQKHNQGPGSVA